MPELPEVEYAAGQLRAWMQGVCVERALAQPTRLLRDQPPSAVRSLSRRTLAGVERRGKYLLLTFAPEAGLLLHLGMTGKLVLRPRGRLEPYGHARFELASGSTVFLRDPRKFGRLHVAAPAALRALPEIAALGPDAWRDRLSGAKLAGLLRTSSPIKIALMDQTVIAGLGNIHAAEALFRARIDPRRRADRLKPAELDALARAIRETIRFALRRMPPIGRDVEYVEEPGGDNPFLVYGRPGERCPRCAGPIRSVPQGGRTTWFCPRCQR